MFNEVALFFPFSRDHFVYFTGQGIGCGGEVPL